VSRQAVDTLKQQIPLLDYLQTHDWKPARRISRGRLMGLCPLHSDRQPSFLVDPSKHLFYCYGCGRGGDVIRFVELQQNVRFSEAVAVLWRWRGSSSVLEDVSRFYQIQLHCHTPALRYLQKRGVDQPETIEQLRIGYAPGRCCLRRWLTLLGHSVSHLQQVGLLNSTFEDTYVRRIVFPLEENLYGRSIGNAAAHRFLPGGKGGLYRWDCVKEHADIILVEGLFDVAALWQAGFRNVTCALGCYLNARQLAQLCDGRRRNVYLAFDSDANGSGLQAVLRLSRFLADKAVRVLRIELPAGHDPNSFFTNGGDAKQFQRLLERPSYDVSRAGAAQSGKRPESLSSDRQECSGGGMGQSFSGSAASPWRRRHHVANLRPRSTALPPLVGRRT
jgi:DNA primase